MAKISKTEILKLARISQIALDEHEVEPLIKQLDSILSYAQRVEAIAQQNVAFQAYKAVNIMREDTVIPTDPAPILAQAPHAQEGYFVVPRILENN